MSRRGKVFAAISLAALVVGGGILGAAVSGGTPARDRAGPPAAPVESPGACDEATDSKTSQIATAKLIIEFNSTDEDIGVHGAFDDHGWKALCVFDPTGKRVLDVGPQGQLRDLTMAGIFFESREPPIAEFSFADLKAAFPEGEYTVLGDSFDGTTLVGRATFTHDVPAPPTITAPRLAEDPRGTRKTPVPVQDLAVTWEDVTKTVDGGPVNITGYQVIVTKEFHDDPHGFSQPIYDVHVRPNLNSLRVPVEFLEPSTVYELEVLALEASGNQTISVGFFKTA
jgi:hypothetical protein